MSITSHKVGTRTNWLALRTQDVTASVVGALLGVHEYMTPFGLWCLKKGLAAEDPEESDAMRRGRLLEPVALVMLKEDNPRWQIQAATEYFRDETIRLGATPDAFAVRPDMPGRGIVQVKTTAADVFQKKWIGEDGEVTPPLWIACQAITEAHLTGADWACVAVLVVTMAGGLRLHVVDVPIHQGLIARIRNETVAFWHSIENDRPPDPDFGRDVAVIHGVYGQDDGTETDLSDDNELPEMLAEREWLRATEKEGEAAMQKRRELDARILVRLGRHARAWLADGSVIEARTVKRRRYVVDEASYRTIRVRPPKRSKLDMEGPF